MAKFFTADRSRFHLPGRTIAYRPRFPGRTSSPLAVAIGTLRNAAAFRYCELVRLLITGLIPVASGRSVEFAELPLVTFPGRPVVATRIPDICHPSASTLAARLCQPVHLNTCGV